MEKKPLEYTIKEVSQICKSLKGKCSDCVFNIYEKDCIFNMIHPKYFYMHFEMKGEK